jgi:hypothetical protein
MPIRHYLQGHRFDPDTARVLGVAFEMALVALQQAEAPTIAVWEESRHSWFSLPPNTPPQRVAKQG